MSWYEIRLDYQLCIGLSRTQIASKIIVGKITATLSILGSSYDIQDVLRNPKKRNESTYHRLMVGLSFSDIIYSFFGWFLGTWVMPKGSHLFAIGSEGSCIASGFFISLLIWAHHYTTVLWLHFIFFSLSSIWPRERLGKLKNGFTFCRWQWVWLGPYLQLRCHL